jgi:hypothetical protein
MTATLWVRMAACLAALYALGHTLGMPWTARHEPQAQAVVVAMQGVHFQAAGRTRSYWEFYQGFGLAISVLLLVEAALLWQLAGMVRSGERYRVMVLTHGLGFTALAIIAERYLFALPLWLALAIAACLAVALALPQPKDGVRGD